MECNKVIEKLDAWIDSELPDHLADQVTRHVNQCEYCQKEAAAIDRLSMALRAMPAVFLPARLSRNTLKAFRLNFKHPGLLEWWQNMNLIMRSTACGIAMAGLLFGFVFGGSLPLFSSETVATNYLSVLYPTEGMLP